MNNIEKKNIFIVEDDAMVRDIIKSALKRDYNVLEASSYEDTIKLLSFKIDLALIDYMLPDCDGFDILKLLRDAKPALPAIIMTGYGDENVVIKAIRSEVVDYIKKPVKLSYLKRRLQQLFGGSENALDNGELEDREEFVLESVAAYIDEKFMKELTLDELSSMACISKSKFCKVFKNKFGRTFTSYLNCARTRKAAELLEKTNLPINDISSAIGYRTVGHFDRVFREIHHESPSEYRKRIKGLGKKQ